MVPNTRIRNSWTKHRQKILTDEVAKSNYPRSRRFVTRLTLVGCLVLAGLVVLVRPSPAPTTFEQVVLINSVGCKHSLTQTVGTVVGNDVVLTVAHGVAGQDHNTIVTTDGRSIAATIAAIDANFDLAVLYAPGLNVKPLVFGDSEIDSSATFVAFEDGLQVSRPAVVLRRLHINTEDIYGIDKVSRPGLEIQAEVMVGNSGGPVINDESEVVAIVWATSRIATNRSWATPVSAATEMLAVDVTAAVAKPVACSG